MRTSIITGASGGLGRAIAIKLSESNDKLFLHGRSKTRLEETSKFINNNCQAELIISDLSSIAGVDIILKSVGETSIETLVNNAGLAIVKPFEELTLEDWQTTLAVNVTAPFLLSRGLLSNMSKGSSIVNILSIASKNSFTDWSSYCMSKSALDGFAKAIREELRGRKIRVINVYPGAIDTDLWAMVPGGWSRDEMMQPENVAEVIQTALKQPFNVTVDDITITNTKGSS